MDPYLRARRIAALLGIVTDAQQYPFSRRIISECQEIWIDFLICQI